MAQVVYRVVEHNDGFAYQVDEAYSETFATHAAALEAARSAAQRQQLAGTDEEILYQDAEGRWHEEFARGDIHPEAAVVDTLPQDEELRDKDGNPVSEGSLPDPDLVPIPESFRRE